MSNRFSLFSEDLINSYFETPLEGNRKTRRLKKRCDAREEDIIKKQRDERVKKNWEKLLNNYHIKIKVGDVSYSTCDKNKFYKKLLSIKKIDIVYLTVISTLYNQNVEFTGTISQCENSVIFNGKLKTECATYIGTMVISQKELETEQFFMTCIKMINVKVYMNLKITVIEVYNQCHSSTGQYSIQNDIIILEPGDFLIMILDNGLRIILPHTKSTVFVYDLPYDILCGLMKQKVITLLSLDNFKRLFKLQSFQRKMRKSICFNVFFSNINNMFQKEFKYSVGIISQEIRYPEKFLTEDDYDRTIGFTMWEGEAGTTTVLSRTGINFVNPQQSCICNPEYSSGDCGGYSSDDCYRYDDDEEFCWMPFHFNGVIPQRVIMKTSECYKRLELYVGKFRTLHNASRKNVEQIDDYDSHTFFCDTRCSCDDSNLYNLFDIILVWKQIDFSPKTIFDSNVIPIDPLSWNDMTHLVRCPGKRTLHITQSVVPLVHIYNSHLSRLMSLQEMQYEFNILLKSFRKMNTYVQCINKAYRIRGKTSYGFIIKLIKRMLINPTKEGHLQLIELNKNACCLINMMMTKKMKLYLLTQCMNYVHS